MNTTALSENVQKTMSSIDLLGVINQSREENGEPSLRRNRFHEKVADELEGEHYTKSVVTNSNGTKSEVLMLTHDQCMLVSMRESKAVRRSVLKKLNAVAKGQPVVSVAATMSLVECAANLLNVSDSGRVVMLRKAGQATNADTSFLPDYTEDSAAGHVGAMDTASATQLLRENGVLLGAAAFNQLLCSYGLIDNRPRKSSGGKTKHFWCITDAGMAYGKNVVSPQSPRETQPHWYRSTFAELLGQVGVGSNA